MSAAAVEEKRNAGLLIESEKGVSFYVADTPTQPEEPTDEPTAVAEIEAPAEPSMETEQTNPEASLRALWTSQDVPQDEQDRLIAGVTEAAQSGAQVGPFQLAAAIDTPPAISTPEAVNVPAAHGQLTRPTPPPHAVITGQRTNGPRSRAASKHRTSAARLRRYARLSGPALPSSPPRSSSLRPRPLPPAWWNLQRSSQGRRF